jgi:hypothetical protein
MRVNDLHHRHLIRNGSLQTGSWTLNPRSNHAFVKAAWPAGYRNRAPAPPALNGMGNAPVSLRYTSPRRYSLWSPCCPCLKDGMGAIGTLGSDSSGDSHNHISSIKVYCSGYTE